MSPESLVPLAVAAYRVLLGLLAPSDRPQRERMVRLAGRALRAAARDGGTVALLSATLGCYVDALRRAWHGWTGSRRDRSHVPPSGRRSVLDGLRQDVRFAVRGIRGRLLFHGGIVLTLAAGIGASTAMFSVADTVLRRPLPFRDGDRLVRIYLMRNHQPPWLSPRAPVLRAVREQTRSFEAVVGQRFTSMTLSTGEGPARVIAGGVTEGWLATLGITPVVGRGFTPQEERIGRESGVALASHAFWQDRYGGSPTLLGATLMLDGSPYTVIGILPPGFAYPYANELYFPLAPEQDGPGRWAFNIQARLRDGVSVDDAVRELRDLSDRLRSRVDGFGEEMELTAIPTRRVLLDDGEDLVTGLFAAVGLLLLIACANVASLLLAHSSTRRRELAVRAALGAGRSRQIRQLVTESLLLSLTAGALGALLAAGTRNLLRGLLPGRLGNVVAEFPLDAGVLGFALGASLLTGLLFGLPLALRSSDLAPADVLRDGGRTGASRGQLRLLDTFVVAELALVVSLLCGAGAMVSNLSRLSHADLGFEPRGLFTVTVSLEEQRYAEADARRRFLDSTLEAIRAIPGVRDAGATTVFPATHRGNFLAGVRRAGAAEDTVLQVNSRVVTPGFLEALGTPLLRGRAIRRDDADGAPVAVLSQRAAELLFPDRDAVGEQLVEPGHPDVAITVVGIVGDVDEQYEVDPTWYLSYDQRADTDAAASVILSARAESTDGLARQLRDAVWSVDPALPVFDAASATQLHRETLAGTRFGTWLISAFAVVGLTLGALGLYGLVSFTVARRVPEIGVRMALGARPGDVVRNVVRAGLARVAAGVALGVAGAVALVRALGSVVAGTASLDPLALAAVATILGIVCLLASWLPARRAARLDPARVLQSS